MKKLTITFMTIMFCLTSSIAWSETVAPTDLMERNGITYNKQITDKPYSGSVAGKCNVGYFIKGTYQEGKKEGVWESYNEDGWLLAKVTYKNGKKIN
jgi:hypothetical protein